MCLLGRIAELGEQSRLLLPLLAHPSHLAFFLCLYVFLSFCLSVVYLSFFVSFINSFLKPLLVIQSFIKPLDDTMSDGASVGRGPRAAPEFFVTF